ncbi:hypothetical protein F4808DRAFT_466627 [Astrocystis sublimbata]|nr:hypothetical protein F4808DRAFT_466627 [Astrocystis sublimbata]
MEHHLSSQLPLSPTQREYQSAMKDYYRVRDENTINEAEELGSRSFVLAENVTTTLLHDKNWNHLEHGQIARLLDTAYRRVNYGLPFQRPKQILDRLPIFYTLLDLDLGHKIHEFVEEGIGELPIELAILERLLPANSQNDAERFYKQQWRWCALKFGWNMSKKASSHQHIIPITAREKIEPTRDGIPKTDRKASLWVVEVPTCFVDKEIDEKLGLPDDDDAEEDSEKTVSNRRLVVKCFNNKRKDEFDAEKKIYNEIGEKDGIVQYIGWYTHCEINSDTHVEETYYNLVLELGAQDLYSAFQKENPPITFSEIQIFWQSMFSVADALASIQVMQSGSYITYLWHGDIKPENILDVRGCFKLADPGEAQVQVVHQSQSGEVPKIPVPGGTRSFAAPEKFTYSPDRPAREPEVTQGSDIWSLGCVFSVAATYAVLGKEGVKQYRLFRENGIKSLGIGIGDPFHDKVRVLGAVTDWHKHLRNNLRRDDCYTAKVLDVVDKKMLITPGESRISGTDLCQELKAIDDEAIRSTDDSLDYIAGFIDKVTHLSKGSISDLEDVPREISKSGIELFSEELLYPSRRSEGRPMSRAKHQHLEESLRGIGTGLDRSPRLIIPERESGFFTQAQNDAINALDRVREDAPSKPPDPPTTFWEVEDHILECQGYHRDHFNFKKLGHYFKRHTSVYGKRLGGKDDQLDKHFTNRDLVYLVDNASSMKRFWQHATYLLKVLVMRSLGYDDNGMELRFTTDSEGKMKLTPKRNQKTQDFLDKMSDARPNTLKVGISGTDMVANLSLILNEHLMKNISDGRKLKRHLTVLVLTDGLWEKNKEEDVDDELVNLIKRIPEESWEPDTPIGGFVTNEKQYPRPRPVSIQFIRFGHHPDAIRRLDRLDNDLKNRRELAEASIPDIIDTEDANGDMYKMFLGSFLEDFDNKPIQGAYSTSGRSVTSPTTTTTTGLEANDYDTPQSPPYLPNRTSPGLNPSPDIPRLSPISGRQPFPWPGSSQGYAPSNELALSPHAYQHHRHHSGEYTASPSVSDAYYMRPRGASQGQQHSNPSSPLTQGPPLDPLNSG